MQQRNQARRLAEAGLTGTLDDQATLAGQQSDAAIANELARLTGKTATGEDTLAGRALIQEGTQFGQTQDLAREELTGRVGEDETLAARQLAQEQTRGEEERRLMREELTGQIGFPGATTPSLAGRQVGTAETAGEFEKERDILNILLAAEREEGFKGMTTQDDLSDRIAMLTRKPSPAPLPKVVDPYVDPNDPQAERVPPPAPAVLSHESTWTETSWKPGDANLSRGNIDTGLADGRYTLDDDGVTVRDEEGIVGFQVAGLRNGIDADRYTVDADGTTVRDPETGNVVGKLPYKFTFDEGYFDENNRQARIATAKENSE
jgi:hypothetical protein